MLLRLLLSSDHGPTPVVVRAAPGTPLHAVRASLTAAGAPEGPLFVDGLPVDDASPLGLPPFVDGAVVGGAPTAPRPTRVGRDASQDLVVVGGPDAGARHDLVDGTHLVGRSRRCDIVLPDPSVSRRHARIVVAGTTVTVTPFDPPDGAVEKDGGSTRLVPGETVVLGRTALALRPRPGPVRRGAPTGDGGIAVNRRPRGSGGPAPTIRRIGAPPERGELARIDLLTVLLPLAVSVVVAIVTSSALFLVFGLLSPVLAVTGTLTERRRRARRHHEDLARYEVGRARVALRLEDDLAREREMRDRSCPDPGRIADIAAGRLDALWDRRRDDSDLLLVRVGRGRIHARSGIETAGRPPRHPWLDDAPVCLRLDAGTPLGLHGRRAETLAVVRNVIAQIATRASPRDVRIWVLAASPARLADWSWAALLPHTRAGEPDGVGRYGCVGATSAQVSRHIAALLRAGRDESGPADLVVLDGAGELRSRPGFVDLLAGPAHLVCVDDERAHLPVECGTVAAVSADGLVVEGPGAVDVTSGAVVPDTVGEEWCARVARALAPLRDVTSAFGAAGSLPDAVDLGDLLAAGGPEDIAHRWRTRPRNVRAVIGTDASGPYEIDLAADGPHVLVGGMTGSGKSELLRTLLVSLAYVNRPDELVYILMDYKGGSAFDGCVDLPHTVGLVTDLDGPATARALASLRAELRRREEVLRAAGVTTIEDYHRRRDELGVAPLPRLLIVVDEFRALAEEQPDLVSGLVRVATQGRSLGLHLVLATQRPAGVVSAEIKANTNLRIALRVRDRPDSQDVIETDDAAALSAHRPGRALLRSGAGDLVAVQIARVGGPVAAAQPPEVHPYGVLELGEPLPASQTAGRAGAPVGRHADLLLAAAALAGPDEVRAPWLPPLPTHVLPSDLVPTSGATGARPDALPFALVDLPDRQSREVAELDLYGGGHLAVVGGAGSGRTTVLRTIAHAALGRCRASTSVHVLDGAHALATLADAVDTYVAADEPARLRRLLRRLATLVRKRAREHPEQSARSGEPRCPGCGRRRVDGPSSVLVLVDDWDRVREAVEAVDADGVDDVVTLLRQGAAQGVRLVLTGGRTLLFGPVGGLVGERYLLRVTDPADVLLAGLRTADAPGPLAGRARRLSDGALVQFARSDAVPDHDPCPRRPAWRHAALPFRIPRTSLDPVPADRHDPLRTALPLGVRADTLETVAVPVGSELLVAGPSGSGRTTTLRTVAAAGLERGLAVVAVEGGTATAWPRGVRVLGPHAELHDLDPGGPHLLLVDDVDRLSDRPAEDALVALLSMHRAERTVLAAGDGRRIAASFRGVVPLLRRSGGGLLLAPRPADRDVFGTPPPTGEPPLPGRGALLLNGRWTVLQVAESEAL